MKEGFRQCMAWLHTWVGLVVGWVLFFVFVTGTAGYFAYEIDRWMRPELPLAVDAPPVQPQQAAALAQAYLQAHAPLAQDWSVQLPGQRGSSSLGVSWREPPAEGKPGVRGRFVRRTLDPATGEAAAEPAVRKTGGGHLLYRMHYMLHYAQYDVAIRLVGACTMLMLLAIVTGVVTHKKIFADFFTFRPGKGQRSWLDAHNAVSVMALPFLLMITYSGLVFFLFTYMPAGRDLLYGSGQDGRTAFADALHEHGEHNHAPIGRPLAPLAPMLAAAENTWGPGKLSSITIERHEGEPPEIVLARQQQGLDFWNTPKLRFHAETGEPLPEEPTPGGSAVTTQSVMLNLHEGLFADTGGRWLYFVSGLLGCAMIGTGLVLWTVKRRKRQGEGAHFGLRLVEALNVATVAGLPLAVATYFWANRLLPVELADRAAWEFHTLFAVWLGTLFYGLARPLPRAWIELLWASCAAYALLPLINALTTDRHLGVTLAQRDWQLAGFDLTVLGLGAIFAIMARKVTRRVGKAATQPPAETNRQPAPPAAAANRGGAA